MEAIRVGDIFNVEAKGPTRICLTILVTETTIMARAVTTQEILEFDRQTGIEINCRHRAKYPFVINSVAALPADIREIMLSLDQKYREVEYRQAEDPNWHFAPGESVLTKEQLRGLLFVSRFYRANPI